MNKKLDDLRRRTQQRQEAQQAPAGDLLVTVNANYAQKRVVLLVNKPTDVVFFTLEQAAAHGITVLSAAIAYGAKFQVDWKTALEQQIERAREICQKEIDATKKPN